MLNTWTTLAYMGQTEWLIIAGVWFSCSAPRTFPQLARSFGQGIREFKKSVSDDEEGAVADTATDDGVKKSAGSATNVATTSSDRAA
jgi:Sec-independent protein translocase protein TatA